MNIFLVLILSGPKAEFISNDCFVVCVVMLLLHCCVVLACVLYVFLLCVYYSLLFVGEGD